MPLLEERRFAPHMSSANAKGVRRTWCVISGGMGSWRANKSLTELASQAPKLPISKFVYQLSTHPTRCSVLEVTVVLRPSFPGCEAGCLLDIFNAFSQETGPPSSSKCTPQLFLPDLASSAPAMEQQSREQHESFPTPFLSLDVAPLLT